MPQFQRAFSPMPSWSILKDQSREQSTCASPSSQSMMDDLQSPSNKKRKSAVTNPLLGRMKHLTKKTKISGDLAGTCALSQSPSKVSSNNRTARIPSGSLHKNAEAGPSSKLNAASQNCNLIIPIRMSSRVSRPTLKKKALLLEERSCPLESDGTPPLSIIPSSPSPTLKRKRPTNRPTKRLIGNNTPSKSKWLDPNPIELTSDDDGSRTQSPQKRVKRTPKKPLSSEVIDLCSENEDVASSPRRTRTRDEGSIVVVLSTDEEVNFESPSFGHSAFRETYTRKSPALPSLGDISSPIEDESVFQDSPSPQAHKTPVPKPNIPVTEEDGIADENNKFAERVDLPRGFLQTLYNEALARCAREPQHAKDSQPSPFSSLKCIPSACNIRYSTQSQSPTLHTPLFFDRIIFRLRDRLKPPKTLDAKAFSDATSPSSMEAFKLDEKQEDTLTHSNPVMESLAVDNEASEIAIKTILLPPIDFQDDAFSDAQAAYISPSIPANDLDVSKKPLSKVPKSLSPLAIQESSLPLEVVMIEDTPIPESIQAREVSASRGTATSESANSSVIPPNILCTPFFISSNPNAVNYRIQTPQEAETFLFKRENCADRVTTIEHSVLEDAQFLVQALRRRYDTSKISGSSLLPASMEHTMTISSIAISSSEDTSSPSKCLSKSSVILRDHATMRDISPHATSSVEDALSTSESSEMPMIIHTEHTKTLHQSSLLASSSNEDASSGAECLSESLAILMEHTTTPGSSSLANSNILNSHNLSPSTRSRQSSDSSASIESVNCRLVTPEDSLSPLTPPVKAQKQEPLICLNPSPSPVVVSFFDMDLSELNLRSLVGNSKFDADDDDDDISISGMELVYPEEII